MRRALFLAACLVLVAVPAIALVGPEPPSSPDEFSIVFEEVTRPRTEYERLDFSAAQGWDFEDRDGYECANVARYDGAGNLLMLLDFEQSRDYLTGLDGGTFRINDRGGVEPGDAGNPNVFRDCGNEVPGPPGNSRWMPSGEDHFPHISLGHDPETHGVRVYLDGQVDPVATDSLNGMLFNDECARGYWTPGDEPGELVLWWDRDFPENAHHDGSFPLDCGGGGAEPVAVARAHFAYLAPNVGVCILDHDLAEGQRCSGMTEPPVAQVQLPAGESELRCPDGTYPALVSLEPFRVLCP
jgi:hypothetical protein